MRHRSAPAIATWLLKRFCSSVEYEAVTGDLIEQYQNGRGSLWYWRQVLVIVLLELYRKVTRRPLIRKNGFSIVGLAVIVVIATLLSVLFSDLWFFWIGVLVAGVVAGLKGLKPSHDDSVIELNLDLTGLIAPGEGHLADAPSYRIRDHREGLPPRHLHRGINTASVAGEGLADLPGLLVMILFVFMFISIFVPRDNQWFLVVFLVVEAGAATLYLLGQRRDRRDSEQLRKALHEINERRKD